MTSWGRRKKDNRSYPKNRKGIDNNTFRNLQTQDLHRHSLKVGALRRIRELDKPGYNLVQREDDIQAVKDYVGEQADYFGGFIVKQGDGYYKEIWGMTRPDADIENYAELIHKE